MSIPISTPSSVPQQVVAGGATAYPTAVQQHHVPTFVTPAMWQDSVASVYEGGLKRSWDFDNTTMATAMSGGKR